MNLIDELSCEISRTIVTLRMRGANTADAEEATAITQAIGELNGKISILEEAGLLRAADILADATEDITSVIGAARRGPFDGYLAAIEAHLNRLYRLSAEMHAADSLAPALAEDAAEAEEASRAPARPRGLSRSLQAPIASKDFTQLQDEYQAWYDACTVRKGYEGNVAYYVKKLRQGEAVYRQVETELGIPWYFVGIIHGMECGFNFNGHLHNGDPLSARTVQVPAGRPAIGSPPFTWQQSARDALTMKGYHQVTDWSMPRILYLLERYNGFGYRMRRVPTPYLWSFSNLYSKGKFVQDGKYDPEAVSKQCGAALMLKAVAS